MTQLHDILNQYVIDKSDALQDTVERSDPNKVSREPTVIREVIMQLQHNTVPCRKLMPRVS